MIGEKNQVYNCIVKRVTIERGKREYYYSIDNLLII